MPIVLFAACGDDGGGSTVDARIADTMGMIDAINMTTALTATINSTRELDRAYYGVNSDGTLRVEAYKGGDPGCPTMNSATPDYTLILGRVPAMSSASAMSPSSLFDFTGDLHDLSPAPLTATTVSLTDVVYTPGSFVTFDANVTFPGGTLTGHLYATHCTSLDG